MAGIEELVNGHSKEAAVVWIQIRKNPFVLAKTESETNFGFYTDSDPNVFVK
jgi:hypothetical protein